MSVDSQQYKNTLARWASGVTVVTTLDGAEWKGVTASSFTSVSLEPPLVMICLIKRLYTHKLILECKRFAVNILSQDQMEIGKLFAGMKPEIQDRFERLNCFTALTGCPILPETVGWVDCELRQTYEGGDHSIFLGEVVASGIGTGEAPLLYFNRTWGQFSAQ